MLAGQQRLPMLSLAATARVRHTICAQPSQLLPLPPAETTPFENFSYVCPKPVLVKGTFLA
jgi:hypothetical protein